MRNRPILQYTDYMQLDIMVSDLYPPEIKYLTILLLNIYLNGVESQDLFGAPQNDFQSSRGKNGEWGIGDGA